MLLPGFRERISAIPPRQLSISVIAESRSSTIHLRPSKGGAVTHAMVFTKFWTSTRVSDPHSVYSWQPVAVADVEYPLVADFLHELLSGFLHDLIPQTDSQAGRAGVDVALTDLLAGETKQAFELTKEPRTQKAALRQACLITKRQAPSLSEEDSKGVTKGEFFVLSEY